MASARASMAVPSTARQTTGAIFVFDFMTNPPFAVTDVDTARGVALPSRLSPVQAETAGETGHKGDNFVSRPKDPKEG